MKKGFSRDYSCGPDLVRVRKERGYRYLASGCEWAAVYQCPMQAGVSCKQIGAQHFPSRAKRYASAPRPPGQTKARFSVKKVQAAEGASVEGVAWTDDATLLLHGTAEPLSNDISLELQLRVRGEPRFGACPLMMAANGERVPLGPTRYEAGTPYETLAAQVADQTLFAVAGGAFRIVLKACGFEWSLDEDHHAMLVEFLVRYREQRAWLEPEPERDHAEPPSATGSRSL